MSFKKPTDREPVTFDFNPRDYHSTGKYSKGDKEYRMSKSELWQFRNCPRKWLGLPPVEKTDAMEWGSLVDVLALTPDRFRDQYSICPDTYEDEKGVKKPWNWNANRCKDWREVQHAAGFEVIKAIKAKDAQLAVRSMMKDSIIAEFIESCDKQVALSLDYHDEKTGLIIPIRGMLDLVPKKGTKFETWLGDLKTTNDALMRKWERSVFDQGYHYQAAIYLDLWNSATGEQRDTFAHVIQESDMPFETARRRMSAEFTQIGRDQYTADLALYAQCLVNGFPGYEEMAELRGEPNRGNIDGWSVCEPSSWMIQ